MALQNLDRMAARYAQAIAKTGEPKKTATLLTRALGVLHEQGVYACLLFLQAQDGGRPVLQQLEALLRELPVAPPAPGQNILQFVADNLSGRLDDLLLVRDVYEQALIYGRYSAKARGREEAT